MTKVKEIAGEIITASQAVNAGSESSLEASDSSASPASKVASLLGSFQTELLGQATEHLKDKELTNHQVFANAVFFLQGIVSRWQSLGHRLQAAHVPEFDATQSLADFKAKLVADLPTDVTEAIMAEPGFMQRKAQAEKERMANLAKQRFDRKRRDQAKDRKQLKAKKHAREEASQKVEIKVKEHCLV